MDIDTIINKLKQFGSTEIFENLLGIGSLYSEILISLAIASLLGLLIGLMMRRSVYKRNIRRSDHDWAKMYSSLEKSSQADISNLEFKVESVGHDIRTLQATNRTLMAVLEKDELSARQVSLRTIELNRAHIKSQERLHVVMQRKDEEIARLSELLDAEIRRSENASNQSVARGQASDFDIDRDDTVAISTDQLNAELMDATVQITISNPRFSANNPSQRNDNVTNLDSTYKDATDLDDMNDPMNDSTMAIDKGALAFFRRRKKD